MNGIIGSWLLWTRSTRIEFEKDVIYHFTKEFDIYFERTDKGKRHLYPLKYSLLESTLTIHYKFGGPLDVQLTWESKNLVMTSPTPHGDIWWMERLHKPMIYSKAFVYEDGLLKRL